MIVEISIHQEKEWDSIVKSFANYDVYYLSSYIKAFMLHGDGNPTLIYYYDNDIRAINVVMIREINKGTNIKNKSNYQNLYDIATPYGYGGFIVENFNNKNVVRLNEEYIKYCNSKNIITEFVRFHPILGNAVFNEKIYEIKNLGKTVTIDLTTKENIWNNFSSKNRNCIRKAIKLGVNIYWGRSLKLIEEFIPLYNATMEKDLASKYYFFNEKFYKSILEDLKFNSLIFYALYEEQIISISIVLFANTYMHYHLSATNRDFQNLSPTNLLLYEAACWGCENGFKTFHLGGGLGGEEDNLYKFKKAFNINSNTNFSIGKKIFDQDKYDELVQARVNNTNLIDEKDFFPRYRV